MSESYLDLITIFQNPVETRVFSCKDAIKNKKYDIDKKDVVMFYKYYCETCFGRDYDSWDNGNFLSLSEKIEKHVPVIGNFDFKTSISTDNEEKIINEIVKTYQYIIKKDFEINNKELLCVVLKTKEWYEDDKPCIRYRFQFPFCRVLKDTVNSYISQKVISLLEKNIFLSNFASTLEGGWQESLKPLGDFITMYGSSDIDKPKQISPFSFYNIYIEEDDNGICQIIPLDNAFHFEIHSFFIKDKCESEDIASIDEDCDIEDDYSFSCYTLPIFLSIFYHSNNCSLKEVETHSETSSIIIEEDNEEVSEEESKTDLDLCKEILKHVSTKRFNTKTCFMDIGKALYNSTDGNSIGLLEWIKTSKRSKKFNKEFCEENYDMFESEKVSVRTLGWYFKKDNPKKYENWHRNWCYNVLYDAKEREHIVVGEAFYRCFWLDFMFDGKTWYEFRRNRLSKVDEQRIEKKITNEFIPCFDNLVYQLQGEIQKLNSRMKKGSKAHKNAIEKLQEDSNKVSKLIQSLRNVPFRGCILKSIRTFFYYENLNNVLNKNPSILGCANCIVELTDEKAIKREGKPEDFVTKKLGVPYMPNYSFDHQDVKFLMRYITMVFPEIEIRNYMKNDFSSMLFRRNLHKQLRVWIGDTNGSKSILQKIIIKWFGDYACVIPEEVYSGKKMNSSGPNPEFAQMEDAAVGFTAEPDTSEPLKGPKIKKFTGGDPMYARNCNSDGGAFDSSIKAIMLLNIIPDITGMDEATKNRFMMIPFESRWFKPEEEAKNPIADTFEEQVKNKTFRMDLGFEVNIPRLAAAMNWFAIQNYSNYLKEGLIKPKYIDKYMEEYWSKNDPLSAFIEENLDIPKKEDGMVDDRKYITASDIYPVYTKWFRQNYSRFKPEEKPNFSKFMQAPDRLGKQSGRRWYGYVIKEKNLE